MIIPSFGSFGPQPNLAQGYATGAKIALEEQDLAQRAAADAARIQMERERLGQQSVQFEMELAAKERQLQAEQLRRQQEAEIEKAYKQNMIGLKQRELEQQAMKMVFEAEKAQAQQEALAQHRNTMAGLRADEVGLKASDFARKQDIDAEKKRAQEDFTDYRLKFPEDMQGAFDRFGFKAGIPASVLNQSMKPQTKSFDPSVEKPVFDSKTGEPTGRTYAQTGPNSFRFFSPKEQSGGAAQTVTNAMGQATGYQRIDGRVVPERETQALKSARAELKRFEDKHDIDMPLIIGSRQVPKARAVGIGKLEAEYRALLKKVEDAQKTVLVPQIPSLTPTNSIIPPSVMGTSTNRTGRFKIVTD